mgnify:CR=1 FL=1
MTPAGGYNPYGLSDWGEAVFSVYGTGNIGDYRVHDISGLRPVTNIRSDVSITGSGTMTDPYLVN